MQDTIITFKAKAHTDDDGVRYVKLIEPKPHHSSTDRLVTPKAVQAAWEALYGPNGRVREDSLLVTSFGDGYMPTVSVNIGNVRTVCQWKTKEFWVMVSMYRDTGRGMFESEGLAHVELEHVALKSRNGK